MNLVEALNKGKEIIEEKTLVLDNSGIAEESRKIMETFEEFNHLYPGSLYKEIYDTLNSYLKKTNSV